MNRLKKFLRSPAPYIVWMVFVAASLAGTYFADPYVFGFTAMLLGGASIGVTILALAGVWLSRSDGLRVRASIPVSLVLTFLVLAIAFAILRTFKWA